jgi:hypothetical protein
MPVRPICPDQTMALYPDYFRKQVRNSSKDFNLSKWVNEERKKAVDNIDREERVHPLPVEEFDYASGIRFAGNAGDIMVFSGTHLHATVPNHTQVTRFSVDFRFYHMADVSGRGSLKPPDNIDSEARSADYGLSSCFRLSDFSPFPKD